MIIKLDKNLISYCNLKTNNQTHIAFFEHFADIKYRGFHFILADRELFEILGNCDKLTDKSRGIYRKLFQNYSTEKSIESFVDFHLLIGSDKSRRLERSAKIFIDELKQDTFLSRNKLLLENSADAEIYKNIIQFYKKSNSLNKIRFDWDISFGGGSTTYSEFQRILNEKLYYTLCVLDSDMKAPNSSLGSTAKLFRKKPKNSYFGNHHIIDAHEMENLYPPEVILGMCQEINKFKKNGLSYGKILSDKYCNSTLFLDLKNGMNKFSYHQMDEPSKNYWEGIFKKNKIDYSKCSCKNMTCSHYIIKPFGRKIGDDIKIFISSIDLSISQLLTDVYEEIWEIIGKILFDIFCCPMRTITI